MQAQALDGQMLANDGHVEVGALAASVLLGRGVAVVARRIGAPTGFRHERLPFLVGQPAPLPVRAGILAAVVEEADVVVALLQRLDFALNEVVELLQVVRQVLWNIKIHVVLPVKAPNIPERRWHRSGVP